jgi:hypothetical protein
MTLTSLREPETAAYPVAPVPTESEIIKLGAFITSIFVPSDKMSIVSIFPYFTISFPL